MRSNDVQADRVVRSAAGFIGGAAICALAACFGAPLLKRSAADDVQVIPTAASAPSTTATGDKSPRANATKPGPTGQRPGGAARLPLHGFTPEREAAALTFVRRHHPELADLLDRLKNRRPQEYQKAIRDLFRVSERLALSSEQQPARYELELAEWKLASRIQLLAARLSMGGSPELEQELRQLLAQQLEVHRQLVKLNHEKASARVAALAQELDDLTARKDALVEERYQRALKSVADKPKATAKTGAAGTQKDSIKKDSKEKPADQ